MDKTRTVAINFSVPKEVKDLLKRWADETDRPVSSVIRQLIQQEKERREAARPDGK